MAPLIHQEEEDTMILFSSLFDTHDDDQNPADGEKKVVGKRRRRRSRREGEEAKKRKLSEEQVKFLEMRFGEERKLESSRKVLLASEVGLEPKQVAVWFQNRRARWKNKKLEDEYSILKSEHEAAIVQNSHLEAEVLKLKEQLTEAETKIRKLAGSADHVSGHCGEMISSPSSTSFSVNTTIHYQPFSTGEDQIVYMNEHNYVNMLDWEVFFGI